MTTPKSVPLYKARQQYERRLEKAVVNDYNLPKKPISVYIQSGDTYGHIQTGLSASVADLPDFLQADRVYNITPGSDATRLARDFIRIDENALVGDGTNAKVLQKTSISDGGLFGLGIFETKRDAYIYTPRKNENDLTYAELAKAYNIPLKNLRHNEGPECKDFGNTIIQGSIIINVNDIEK